MAVQKYGSQCLSLVTKVTECMQTDPEEAEQHLATIKGTVPLLLQQLEEQQKEVASKRDELEKNDISLMKEIGAKENEKKAKSREIQSLQERKAGNESLLQDAKNSLRTAERNKRDAQKKKDDRIAGTVAGGVGAAVLGVVFPPSLFVTAPAVASIGTISISEADKEVDRYKSKARETEQKIESEKQQIRNINAEISEIERAIASLNAEQQSLHTKLSSVREAFVFLQKAVTFFSEMHNAVCAGDQKTTLLHKVVKEINKEEKYRILSSDGGVIVVNRSFANAWEKVEDKLQSGGENGYFGITFHESIAD